MRRFSSPRLPRSETIVSFALDRSVHRLVRVALARYVCKCFSLRSPFPLRKKDEGKNVFSEHSDPLFRIPHSEFRIKYAAIPRVPRDDKSEPTAKTKAYNFLPIIVSFPKGGGEGSADARLDERERMSVLLVRDFANAMAETKQMRPYTPPLYARPFFSPSTLPDTFD